MRIGKLWRRIRDFFSHERLEEAQRRHQVAADRLDRAVKEMLRK
jgi:hypothetical protein